MRRTWIAAALAGACFAVVSPAPAGAVVGAECPPDDGFAPQPGECRTYGYTITNPNAVDATFFVRIDRSSLVVRDGNDAVVPTAQRDAFLNAYYTVEWQRYPFLTVPDPADAGRSGSERSGGVDVLVEPVARDMCGSRPVTDESQCRLGRIRRSGSRTLTAQATDSRAVNLIMRYSSAAADGRYAGWYLANWTVRVVAAVPAASDCPAAEASGVCTAPVYER